MDDIVIRVENLSKRYRIGVAPQRHDTLRDALVAGLRAPLAWLRRDGRSPEDDARTIWSLKDVSFEVERGEVVGIIGRNGAGKSTLLKILSRITKPTEGRVVVRGRVGSLLEVGTGFHPELTGRENIYLNGAILGMGKAEIDRRFDEIVAFAEIEKFLDTPVKRYSSGMYVRLAFAVAAHLEPEILLVDEVLAVGDAEFQQKCLGKMSDVAKEGRTVLFVSHNMGAISTLCGAALLLEGGKKELEGAPEQVIHRYLGQAQRTSAEWCVPTPSEIGVPILMRAVRVKDDQGNVRADFTSHEPVIVEIEIYMKEWIPYLKVGFDLETEWGTLVFTSFHNDVHDISKQDGFQEGMYCFEATIPGRLLSANVYYISPSATVHRKRWLFQKKRLVQFKVQFQIDNPAFLVGERPGVIGPLLDWKVVPLA